MPQLKDVMPVLTISYILELDILKIIFEMVLMHHILLN